MDGILSFLVWLAIGGVIGWLAGIIMKSSGSILVNILIGIVGGFVGGFISGILGIGGGWFIGILFSIGGACLVIIVARALKIIK
ncbi:MAG: GlsB/YeaQ/YmgE family stress response membrane protein [Defluviitaleaceae bacterium]|nr:GlsB/YeaQ/YmgE family stress response membrane protein [Defluviitaleaceae bacterium]